MTIPAHRLCVYCGSSPGHDVAHMVAARSLGAAMAAAGIGLVYGGGGTGLMGEVARAVLAGGGHVTGIIPEFLVSKERMLEEAHELIVTRSMHDRKMAMFERSTGFVALPGGIGTLEELAEIMTWAQLKQHARPVILCNVNGFWDGLLALFQHMRDEGFIRTEYEVRVDVADSADAVIETYLAHLAQTRDVVPLQVIKDRM
jgi:uncharacterized protein (TIGR00730 family)